MTTTILELNKPTQGDTNWHIPINANFDSIDSKLGQAYKYLYEIDGVTYISSNAKYVTDHWERWDTSKGAYLIKIDGDNNTKTEYYCLAGLGEITWIEMPLEYTYIQQWSIVSDDVLYLDTTTKSITEGVSKIFSTTIPDGLDPYLYHSFRITCDVQGSGYVGFEGYTVGCIYIYKNGESVGVSTCKGESGYITGSHDVNNWQPGDTIEIWASKSSNTGVVDTAYAKNFCVKGTFNSRTITLGKTDMTW